LFVASSQDDLVDGVVEVVELTTFLTMSYILAVNPIILGAAGMDKGAVFTATVVAAIVATLIMAIYAKLPFALASSMGLNAFFAYTLVGAMGYTWEQSQRFLCIFVVNNQTLYDYFIS